MEVMVGSHDLHPVLMGSRSRLLQELIPHRKLNINQVDTAALYHLTGQLPVALLGDRLLAPLPLSAEGKQQRQLRQGGTYGLHGGKPYPVLHTGHPVGAPFHQVHRAGVLGKESGNPGRLGGNCPDGVRHNGDAQLRHPFADGYTPNSNRSGQYFIHSSAPFPHCRPLL